MTAEQTVWANELHEIPLHGRFPLVWLASWYPSDTYPTNGDFIQRHALALDRPLLVIHTIHAPSLELPCRYSFTQRAKVGELIVYFRQDREGGPVWNRWQYHRRYVKYTRQILKYVVQQCGLPEWLHVHVPMKMGPLAQWAKRLWGIPYMVSEQSSKYVGDGPDQFSRRSSRHQRQVAGVFKAASAVTNVSATVGKLLAQLFDLDEVKTIYNVADTSVFYPTVKPFQDGFQFIHVSTLKEQKNISGMIRAFSKVYQERKDFTLTLVGGDPAQLQDWEKGKHPWLVRTGTVAHSTVAGYMQAADALVMFSIDENFPCVIAEALCCGLPVITSNAGGSGEIIGPGRGIVVPVGDEASLVSAILTLMDNRKNYNAIGIASWAAEHFSMKVIGREFRELYRAHGLDI